MKGYKIFTVMNTTLATVLIGAGWLLFFGATESVSVPQDNHVQSLDSQNQTTSKDKKKSDSPNLSSESAQVKKNKPYLQEVSDFKPTIAQRVVSLPNAIKSAVKFKLTGFKPNPKINVPIKGDIRVEIIDESTICLVGSYQNFLNKQFVQECGGFLKGIDSAAANLPSWSRNVFYNVLGAEIILKYRPKISSAYKSGIKLNGKEIKTAYWLNPNGQATFPDISTGEIKLTQNAQVVHFAFAKLPQPLKEGAKYTLENQLGEAIEFTYQTSKNLSPAIKVNQVGYSPESRKKYAYIGAWLAMEGAWDNSYLLGKDFFIQDKDSNNVYSSKLKKRVDDVEYKTGSPFTGENVLEADFSDFNKEGIYRIYIEGVGISLPFEISNKSIGDSFYVHSKGLYHKRCGIAKEKPFTNWTMGECHMRTYRSDFPPNNLHYRSDKKRPDAGFFDEDGKPVDVSHFKLIQLRATDEVLDVYGGWHDAGDYDRRSYHYDVVCDILAPYLFRPQNFSDSQLNIPESGNGIADILDEAEWGMSVWLKAQNPDGSVGGWIEATSHPKDYNPSTDEQRYYLSAATRESTMQYASHASMLALAYKQAGETKISEKWLESATKAYKWADVSANRFTKDYMYPKNAREKNSPLRKITYKELPDIPSEFTFKAAFNLYLLTGNKIYLQKCVSLEKQMPQKISETSWKTNPLFFSEFLKFGSGVPELDKTYRYFSQRMLKFADEKLEMMDNYPYRIPWYAPSHPYVSNMSWGIYHPLRVAKFFVNAYELTKDKKYQDAAFLCNDFHNGANPNATTMTSGLGVVYPVRFLDLPSYADSIPEFVLGITPYRNTFGIARDDIALAHGLFYKPRKDRDFNPTPIALLSGVIPVSEDTSLDEYSKELGKVWPIWRRWANVEAYSVAASEFTVSETIAPAMSTTAWLLKPNYSPSEKIKNKKPVDDISKLPGFSPLP